MYNKAKNNTLSSFLSLSLMIELGSEASEISLVGTPSKKIFLLDEIRFDLASFCCPSTRFFSSINFSLSDLERNLG